MNARFDEVRKDIREGLQAADFSNKTVDDRVTTLAGNVDSTHEDIAEVTEVTEGLRTRSTVQGIRIAEIEMKIEQLEREKRKNIIVVEGVPETEGKSSPEVIEELFADLKVDFDTLLCDRIFRRGKAPPGTGDRPAPEVAADNNNARRGKFRHRPIVVGFKELGNKIQIYRHVKNLQGLEKWKKRVYKRRSY